MSGVKLITKLTSIKY